MLGKLTNRSSLRIELRCSRIAVFFSLNPKRDYITFIPTLKKIIPFHRLIPAFKTFSVSINISIEC
jgi:hypothetical protein